MNALNNDNIELSNCLLPLRRRRYAWAPGCACALVLLPSTSVMAQCGGTIDCPITTLFPLAPAPTATTEINPGGNFLNWGPVTYLGAPVFPPPNPNFCIPATRQIRGISVLRVGVITETVMFTSAGPGDAAAGPAIEVMSGGLTTPLVFPLTGTTMMSAGVACLPGLGESIGITDAVIATVSGGVTTEHPLPLLGDGVTTSAPVSAVGIFGCLGRSNSFTLVVETSVPTI